MRYYSSVAQSAELQSAVDSSSTLISVSSTTGWPISTPFTVAIDAGDAAEELVTVTSVAGTVLTVERGQDGTAAVSHSAGAAVRHMSSARDFREPQEHMGATTNVHGVASPSAVVGTASAQTLTNKTISGADNTITSIPQSAVTGLASALSGKQPAGDYATNTALTAGLGSKASLVHSHTQTDLLGNLDAYTWDGHRVFVQSAAPAYVAGGIWFKTP